MTKSMKNEIVSINKAEMSCCIAYVIYMIVSSYMSRSCMVTKNAFDRCRKCYAFLDDRTQLNIESLCIDFVEDELIPELPTGFLDQDFKVSIRYMKKAKVQAVVFENDDFSLWMSAKPKYYPFFITGVFLRNEAEIQEQPAVA